MNFLSECFFLYAATKLLLPAPYDPEIATFLMSGSVKTLSIAVS